MFEVLFPKFFCKTIFFLYESIVISVYTTTKILLLFFCRKTFVTDISVRRSTYKRDIAQQIFDYSY